MQRTSKNNFFTSKLKKKYKVPTFLSKLSETILLTGKYLNVIRECGKNVECPFSEDLNNNYEILIQTQ